MSTNASPLAVLFPGQGSQEQNMGRDLAESVAQAMELWQSAEKASGLPLREIYWDGDATAQADTRNLQPAMTVVCLNLWLALKNKISPMAAAGHSLGEYAALAAAGALPIRQVLELVSLRGKLMAEAAGPAGAPGSRDGGAMAAILKVSLPDVEAMVAKAAEVTGGVLLVANYNTPGQYVISGRKDAVDQATGLCKELKGRAIPLAVSGAFHSPLMAEAAAEMAKPLKKADWHAPSMPVYMNVTGAAVSDPMIMLDLLTRQMTSSVRWIDTMRALYDDGARTFLEIGPKGVLSKMVKPNLEGRPVAKPEAQHAAQEDWQTLNVATAAAAEAFAL